VLVHRLEHKRAQRRASNVQLCGVEAALRATAQQPSGL